MNYEKLYKRIISFRQLNSVEGYSESHHIKPRCLGGDDSPDNLVDLTAREHYMCHLLLTKMFAKGTVEYYKMVHAFFMMTVSSRNHGNRLSSKPYAKLREDYARYVSMHQSGDGNSQFGTIWIHNASERRSTKIRKGDPIPEGWSKGRVINFDSYELSELAKQERQVAKAKRNADREVQRLEKKARQEERAKLMCPELRAQRAKALHTEFVISGLSLRKFAESKALVAMTLSTWFRTFVPEYT